MIRIVLVDDGNDDSRDERPVVRQRCRDDRLDVQRELVSGAVRSDLAVPIQLKRNADQGSDGVAELSREFRVAAALLR